MARKQAWNGKADTSGRVLAALIGSFPPSITACALFARLLPISAGWAATLAGLLALPLWLVVMTAVFLQRRAAIAWTACVAATLLLGGSLWLLGPPPAPQPSKAIVNSR